MAIIKESLFQKSNDYTNLEKNFEVTTGLQLITRQRQQFDPDEVSESVSVVIPAYMGHRTLPITLRALQQQVHRNFEVLIVDDASPVSLLDTVARAEVSFPIKFVRHLENTRMCPSAASNTGIFLAEGRTVVLMDQDMVPDETYLLNLAGRQQYSQDCVFIGFRENISYTDWEQKVAAGVGADLEADWRYRVKVNRDFIPLNLNMKEPRRGDEAFIINETNYLKKLGHGESIEYWDLPCMVTGHSLCFRREAGVVSGGVPEIFTGWGVEDIAFGAALIAHGQYVIPALNCVSYHIDHERHSGSIEKQWQEFRANLGVYFCWVDTPVEEIKFPGRVISKTGKESNMELYETGP
ncbi:MAG TPA: glycosyltransferase family 2 protein [Pyrinomonadaceae bacterium]